MPVLASTRGRPLAGREREADSQVAAGEVTTHESADDFLKHLDTVEEE